MNTRIIPWIVISISEPIASVNVPAYYSTTHFSTILEFEIWKIVKYERNATLSEIKQKEYRKIKEDPKILNFGATSWI